MPLFGIALYGIPVTFIGIAYVVFMTPFLLARSNDNTTMNNMDKDDLLLGARVTQYSPCADRTIKRSGLRETGGVYLVRVRREATGNVHSAVGPDFVLQVGDTLYFTGMVETFGNFCEEHGLELVTDQLEIQSGTFETDNDDGDSKPSLEVDQMTPLKSSMPTISEGNEPILGTTLESLIVASPQERMRVIFSMEDFIRTDNTDDSKQYLGLVAGTDKDRIVVGTHDDLLIVAIDAPDRSGLLLDISKCLARLDLELHHTEAAVKGKRSLSIWRCKSFKTSDDFCGQVWSVLHALLTKDSGVSMPKQRGLQIVRAVVRSGGRLVGKTALDVAFYDTYKAAIVAVQKAADGKTLTESLSTVTFDVGDTLVLQVASESPLLETPPSDDGHSDGVDEKKRLSFFRSRKGGSSSRVTEGTNTHGDEDIEHADELKVKTAIWNDLEVIKATSDDENQREFLTAMKVLDNSGLVGKTVSHAGIDKLPGVYLVSLDRPMVLPDVTPPIVSYQTIPVTESLKGEDVLWFSGTASAIGDLRKIPGLDLYDTEELTKMNEKVHFRRLVEAVVARNGSLVGKTAKDSHFRTKYGAAVIAVHREGQRVHELPSNIKLQAGDVLLLEVGQSFLGKNMAVEGLILMADVKDSAAPRFRMLLPAVVLTVAAYGCYVAKLSTLFGTAMVAAILMVFIGVLTQEEARSAIKWEIYLTIAPAFGVGQALINSGVAGAMANFLVRVGNAVGLGSAGLIGAVYLATVLTR